MENILIIAVIILAAACAALAFLLRSKKSEQEDSDAANVEQRLDNLERTMYEALRDLRGEQNTLARAARMENAAASDRLSEQIDKRVARLADLTDKNLERIRMTVDENLNASLDRKFALVGKRLEEMHRGLGEMQGLAVGVDDLKRILSNVKTRGIWGEMQLGNLLKDMLPAERIAENVEVNPRSGCRVEFALKLPGDSGNVVYLPIDAKFPQEDYQRLQQAREKVDADAAAAALKQLERRLKAEAKDICEKYLCPPYSTDFGIMFLPSEGLFVEAVNMPGLLDALQRDYRVCVAGPTTLAALVNSLHMGFRTLAVQQKTDEVWRTLAAIGQDMSALAAALEKTAKKLAEAESSIDAAQKRVNILTRRLAAAQKLEDKIDKAEAGGGYEQQRR